MMGVMDDIIMSSERHTADGMNYPVDEVFKWHIVQFRLYTLLHHRYVITTY